ncbi:MAG: (d)CMP kinase [Planctomycetales bacterium]|nr:(d)CMP kinase [Planctomycetales bacterium]
MIVTIDGPAGTGKSTVAKTLASRLGFEFLNTGAMYRAVAYACLQREIDLADVEAVGQVAPTLEIAFTKSRLILDGHDVTEAIHGQEVTLGASVVAANPLVRGCLVALQQAAARGTSLVTEGRDQGTVVFPEAECKFFLTASPVERAKRRQLELQAKGEVLPLEDLLSQQALRDERDQTRACSPLQPAEDAILIDTTAMSLEEVTGYLESLVHQRLA